ncbi:MAG: His/Gly/Thr/Pro-type tRNA ligase C-terminal domain-containing protein, partial [Candidatus Magasanikbacteria bacterium]|nr:His/Gly/Thr/Pro-type tRNA ligase C-terminal domain-containing protein [Candidatus Magasanikbacteria bacterium]
NNVDIVDTKGNEVGNNFKIMARSSSAIGFKYLDAEGKEQQVEMGCYGIGPSRVMGTMVEVFHDDKGIIWPESVAPFKYHLLALGKEDETFEQAEIIYKNLISAGAEVLYDDRRGVTAGEKFADADLIGLPIRLIVSKKTLAENSVELKRRNETEASLVKISDLM